MLYAPHIKQPILNSVFNFGHVDISWDINNPPSDDIYLLSDSVTYEIEYTDNYNEEKTNWYALKRRIPWEQTELIWNVGKMLKSRNLRIRIRAFSTYTQSYSDYSVSDNFSVNVFKLTAPAIVSPIPGKLYSDYVLIILDESLTKQTYHQKVRYTLEYASEKSNIGFTTIVSDIPVGKNVIRWNLDGIPTSDDYIIKLTVKNANSCTATNESPDQIAVSFAYNISIQQSGLFIIDTKPPEGLLEIESSQGVTNELNQIISVFADDETTEVQSIQLRECAGSVNLSLGDIEAEDTDDPYDTCSSIQELLSGDNIDFDNLIGKSLNFTSKIKWTFSNTSGIRKIEAILTDAAGNTSLQDSTKVFLSLFDSDSKITDFIIVIEQRDRVMIDNSSEPPSIIAEPSLFEVVYLGTESGEFWTLQPFPTLLFTIDYSITKLISFNDSIIILAYDSNDDAGIVLRNDRQSATILHQFTDALSRPTSVAIFKDSLYIGFLNGELWKYDGSTFVELSVPTDEPINFLDADEVYLYIGYLNSDNITLYNETEFFVNDIGD